jgi:hypothetical protein
VSLVLVSSAFLVAPLVPAAAPEVAAATVETPSETPDGPSAPPATAASPPETEGAGAEGTEADAATRGEIEYRVLSDDIYLTLGGFLVSFETQATAGIGGVLGTRIDLEDDLGVDNGKNTFRLDGFWRYKPKHALGFSFFALTRSGFNTLADQIEFEDAIFEVGAEVDSRFETDWFGVGYRYSMLKTERGEAGIGVGLSTYAFDLALAGEATVDDGSGPETQDVDLEEGIVAPVPVFGIFLGYGITPRLYFQGNVAIFKASISDWSVRLLDSRLTLDYFFSRHVGVGFGLNGTDIDVARSGDDPFSVTYRQSGLLVYLSLGF